MEEFATVHDWFRWHCPLCGWKYEIHDMFDFHDGKFIEEKISESCLTALDINSPQLALTELGTHLKNNFSDVYSLSPRRFEMLICDIFRKNGHESILTQQTRDGGVDIVLTMNKQTNTFSIIECKRYSKTRKIGVEAVRLLLGTAVDWGTQNAYLVTSSNFSDVAVNKAKKLREKGYQIDLVSATELCTMLNVYNTKLPRLDKITNDMIKQIVSEAGIKY